MGAGVGWAAQPRSLPASFKVSAARLNCLTLPCCAAAPAVAAEIIKELRGMVSALKPARTGSKTLAGGRVPSQ